MRKALLLVNPIAGGRRTRRPPLPDLTRRLREGGIECEIAETAPKSLTAPRLDLADKELLIVLGGDGTIHHALDEVVRWRRPLAILPGGTVNVLARELGIPLDLDAAVNVVTEGASRRMFLGRAGDARFHLMAGIGIDGHVIDHVGSGLKHFLGDKAYWASGMASFWTYPLRQFEVSLDDEVHQATFAVAANARTYGGDFLMAPQASVFEPGLDVCLFTSRRRLRYVTYLRGVRRGEHVEFPDVIYRRVQKLEVRGPESIRVQLDGELHGTLPMTFSTESNPVEILLPASAPRSN